MAKLTFTAPLVPQSLVSAKIQTIEGLDLQRSRLSVVVRLKSAGGNAFAGDQALLITNGQCAALVSSTNQAGWDYGTINNATAYDQVMAAIRGATAGNEEAAVLVVLVTLGVLPAGSVA